MTRFNLDGRASLSGLDDYLTQSDDEPRRYHARPISDGYAKGFGLYFEDGDDLAEVPEAGGVMFPTEDEALAFAHRIENGDHYRDLIEAREAEAFDLSDDAEALASAGMVEEP